MTTRILISCLLLARVCSLGAILPDERVWKWSTNAGTIGGIPDRQTIYATISPLGGGLNDATNINAKIAACPSNQVVYCNAGTYEISSVVILKSNVTLRGAGSDLTKFLRVGVFSDAVGFNTMVEAANLYSYSWDQPSPAKTVSWVSGYSQGTTTITMSSTNRTNATFAGTLPLGQLIFLDKLNDTNTTPFGACDTTGAGNGGDYTSLEFPNTGKNRLQHQLSRVMATNGNTVTIWPGVQMTNYTSGELPQIWWEGVPPIENAGIEGIHVAVTNSGYIGVLFFNAFNCWAKDIKVSKARYHVRMQMSVGCELRGSTIEGQSGSTDDYPFHAYHVGGVLVEDNIFHDLDQGTVIGGMSGSVFAYNYLTNHHSPGFMHTSIILHGGHPSMNLFEGNVGVSFAAENCWGSSYGSTVFRNRFVGYDFGSSGSYNYVQAIHQSATNRANNIVGNVLGTASTNYWYEDYQFGGPYHETGRIFYTGNLDNIGGPFDPIVRSSMIRHMNWFASTNGPSSGWSHTNSVDFQDGYTADFANLPTSMYKDSKPSVFGFLTWPPIDPQSPTYSASITNIPAGYRFINGTNPPAASVASTGTRGNRIRGLRLRP